MIENPTNRDKNWQKEAYVTDDTVTTIANPLSDDIRQANANRLLSNLKVQGSRPKEARVKIGKVARYKAVRMEPEGIRREYPEESYLSSFTNQNFSGFLFGRDKKIRRENEDSFNKRGC